MTPGWPKRAHGVGEYVERRAAARAQERADAAAQRLQELRAGGLVRRPRRPMSSWQQLVLLILGIGVGTGFLWIWFLTMAYLRPGLLLVAAVITAVVAGMITVRAGRLRGLSAGRRLRRPTVADLVRAAEELRVAQDAVHRRGGRPAAPP